MVAPVWAGQALRLAGKQFNTLTQGTKTQVAPPHLLYRAWENARKFYHQAIAPEISPFLQTANVQMTALSQQIRHWIRKNWHGGNETLGQMLQGALGLAQKGWLYLLSVRPYQR
jgi:hypothetical protein